ncbi:MAG: Uncharacterised protein [Bacteroidetes bacterium MED-G17]|nr:MAG: Uncharacterised protein [Bacteroidetes bacterium MED-G17]
MYSTEIIFGIGIFVTLITSIGIYITIKEFNQQSDN